jgi:predicted RNA binding protein YcfA (HicA-like mRNA interferase family)
MNLSAKFLIKILLQFGFEYRRSKGSHQVYFNKTTNKTVIVPLHGNKDLPKGTFFTILKQAGIDKNNLQVSD